MFNLGGGEILVILLLALIVLGPERLPEAARKLGTAIGEVRRMASGFQNEIKAALDDAELTTGSRPTTATPTTSKARPVTEPSPLPAERSPNGTPSSIGPATPGASQDGAAEPADPVEATPGATDGTEVVEGAANADPGDGSGPAGRDDAVA